MSIATGMAPGQLPLRDAAMWDALLDQLERRWSHADEMLAALVELTHAHLLAFLRVHGKKSARLPAPLVVPRPELEPEAADRSRAQRVSIAELAELAATSGANVRDTGGGSRGR